jgi:hypothetical protein
LVSSNDLTSFTNLLSVIVATVALIVAIRAENRAAKRFEEGLKLQERLAVANIQPRLVFRVETGIHFRRILMRNTGLGTAVIKKLLFRRDSWEGADIASVLDMSRKFDFDRIFNAERTDVKAREDIELLVLSELNLAAQGLMPVEIEEIFQLLDKQIANITIDVTYEDILGNEQPFTPFSLTYVQKEELRTK